MSKRNREIKHYHDESARTTAAKVLQRLASSSDESIAFKASKEILDNVVKIEQMYLEIDKYEDPAIQRVEHEIKGIQITFESPDSK
jgi:hypothetical protein